MITKSKSREYLSVGRAKQIAKEAGAKDVGLTLCFDERDAQHSISQLRETRPYLFRGGKRAHR